MDLPSGEGSDGGSRAEQSDVAEEEVTEDIQKQAGIQALDKPYMQTRLVDMVRARGIWLCILLLLQVATIGVLDMFQSHLEKAAILVSFIPLIISSGGNTGTQAASLLIRAISLEEIEHKDWTHVITRELRTGLILGAVLGVLAFAVVVGLDATGFVTDTRATGVGLTVGISILAIVIWGVIIGSMFPIILDRIAPRRHAHGRLGTRDLPRLRFGLYSLDTYWWGRRPAARLLNEWILRDGRRDAAPTNVIFQFNPTSARSR